MKFWILVMAAVVLLVVSLVRERFEATQSIKAPPYDAAEKRRIFDMVRQRSASPPYSFLGYQDILMDKAKQQLPNETNQDKLKEAAGGFVSPAVEAFFTTVFKPATTPITKEQVNTFVDGRASEYQDDREGCPDYIFRRSEWSRNFRKRLCCCSCRARTERWVPRL